MADFIKFGQNDGREPIDCEVCEAMCLDAVDGTLTEAEESAFERHVAGCVMCAEQLAEARRGAAWMEMLKSHRPEPSATLLTKILQQTTGVVSVSSAVESAAVAAYAREAERRAMVPASLPVMSPAAPVAIEQPGLLMRVRTKAVSAFSFKSSSVYFQPRMAMTAAMAFFSIALTMNLTGIRPGDLKPSSLHRTVADVSANAARQFQSLRVVNQFESRLSEMQHDDRNNGRDPGGPFGETSESPKQTAPATTPQEQKQDSRPEAPNGSSELTMPQGLTLERVSASNSAARADEKQTAPGADAPLVRKGA